MLLHATRRRRYSLVAFAVLLCSALGLAAGCGSPQPSTYMKTHARHAMFVVQPATGVYFGAQVNPSQNPDYGIQETETENLETTIGRKLALHNEYRSWSDLSSITSNSSDPEIYGDIQNNRVPVIALHCLDNINGANYNLEQIGPGLNHVSQVDTDLAAIKTALSTIVYPGTHQPYPIMLRWFWEFNKNAANPTKQINGNEGCFVQDPSEPFSQQFVSAWTYIHHALEPTLGTPNITFVWNPSVQILDNDGLNEPLDPYKYWPGSGYVDWIGADGYSTPGSDGNPRTFDKIFSGFFEEFANSTYGNKPFVIGETGACADYQPPYDQGTWIPAAQSEIQTNSLYSLNIFGFMYFDAVGQYVCDWSLTPVGINPKPSGIQAFAVMGQSADFSPMVTPAP